MISIVFVQVFLKLFHHFECFRRWCVIHLYSLFSSCFTDYRCVLVSIPFLQLSSTNIPSSSSRYGRQNPIIIVFYFTLLFTIFGRLCNCFVILSCFFVINSFWFLQFCDLVVYVVFCQVFVGCSEVTKELFTIFATKTWTFWLVHSINLIHTHVGFSYIKIPL